MLNKKLHSIIGKPDNKYKIRRLTYNEAQSYHSSLTVGYEIKSRDEKFRIVLVINDTSIRPPINNGLYGYPDTPYYNENNNSLLQRGWYELRIYCDQSIMNLGYFTIDFHDAIHSNYNRIQGRGPDLNYNGEYYVLACSDNEGYFDSSYINFAYNIAADYNLYLDTNDETYITIQVLYDYSLENALKGLSISCQDITFGEDATIHISYNDNSTRLISLRVNFINYNENRYTLYNNNFNSTQFEINVTVPADLIISGYNQYEVIYNLSDNFNNYITRLKSFNAL